MPSLNSGRHRRHRRANMLSPTIRIDSSIFCFYPRNFDRILIRWR